MIKKAIQPKKLANPAGPYSLAIKAKGGNLLFIAGTVGFDEAGKLVEGGFVAQCRQVFENLKAVLEASGGTFDNLVSTTNYVVNAAEDYAILAEIRKEYLGDVKDPPASTLIEVKNLINKDILLEIEAIAVLD